MVECKSERGAIPLIKRTIKNGNEFIQLYLLLKILDAKLSRFPVKEPKGVREGRALSNKSGSLWRFLRGYRQRYRTFVLIPIELRFWRKKAFISTKEHIPYAS